MCKQFKLQVCFAASMSFLLSPQVLAQEPADTLIQSADEEDISATVAPKLLTQIKLSYPPEALAERKHGDVSVLVVVDEEGEILSAEIESGPTVFHEAALKAVEDLKFVSGTKGGIPQKMNTRVYFHFVPPKIDDAPVMELLIDDHGVEEERIQAQTVLDERALERSSGSDLASTIEQVPGVQRASSTSDAAKPIIRGHQERQLLVLHDGIRHESQKWGPDHGTEIDPFSAGDIAVVRGALGARYGSDAIGGVVLVNSPTMRSDVGVGGKIASSFTSNGLRPYAGGRIDFVPSQKHRLAFRVEGNATKGATLESPTYILGNTGSQIWNLGLVCSYVKNNHQLQLSWRHHDFKAGIFYGVQNSSSDEFKAQLNSEKPVTAHLWSSTYEIDRPYQDVTHDVVSARLNLVGDWGDLETSYAFQFNNRQEFEQVRSSITGAQYHFKLRTHSLDLVYTHPAFTTAIFDLEGGVGIQGGFQENVYLGYRLIPNFRSFNGGVFGFERISFARVDIEGGLRYDRLRRAVFLHKYDYEHQLRQGRDMDCDYDGSNARCDDNYDTTSVSLGAIFHIVPNHLDLRVEISSSGRFPNIDELYFNGNTPSFPVYALGNPELGIETSRGGSTTLGVKRSMFNSEISLYSSLIENFIYFAPSQAEDGKLLYEVNIRGAWPKYAYEPVLAQYSGLDGRIELLPDQILGLNVRGALVRAKNVETEEFLIGIPPDRLELELLTRMDSWRMMSSSEIAFHVQMVAMQDKTDLLADFAPPPDGYTLLGLSAETSLTLKQPLRIGLRINNLSNVQYREYMSLMRYYADQPRRDVRIWAAMDF